jgi:mRNA interferase MazF
MDYKRGDVHFADLGNDGVGSEQNGTRPVLIVQNNIGNRFSPTVVVACITSNIYKTTIPTHVLWDNNLILCEQIKTIDKSRLREKMATLSPLMMDKVNRAIRISLDL